LAENGDAKCHRYWPDNGSEVLGVFEVHLVSEHIWSEDYLVRSFYLKNLRTKRDAYRNAIPLCQLAGREYSECQSATRVSQKGEQVLSWSSIADHRAL